MLVPAVIALGVLRGTLLGPIKDVGDIFGSTYGTRSCGPITESPTSVEAFRWLVVTRLVPRPVT